MTNEQLVTRIKAGIDIAGNMLTLWQQNLSLIGIIADKYKGLAEKDDLMQEGYIALCKAVDGYDPEQGVQFMSYAGKVIRMAMRRYLYSSGTVRIPEHENRLLGKYVQLESAFLMYFGRKPTDFQIGYYLELSGQQVQELKKARRMSAIGSLDAPLDEEGELTVGNMVPDETCTESSVLDEVQQEELQAVIWSLVDSLPGKMPDVLRARYVEGLTLKETGERIGTTIEGARQWQSKAFRELRKPSNANQLLPFWSDSQIYSRAIKGGSVGRFNRTWTSSTEYVALGFS